MFRWCVAFGTQKHMAEIIEHVFWCQFHFENANENQINPQNCLTSTNEI